jgi:hypothetical protein
MFGNVAEKTSVLPAVVLKLKVCVVPFSAGLPTIVTPVAPTALSS